MSQPLPQSSQPAQRQRKTGSQNGMQSLPQGYQRENTPSPTFRERQARTIKANPQVPSVGQVLASVSDSSASNRPPLLRAGTQQPSPTTSTSSIQSHHTPPPGSVTVPSPPVQVMPSSPPQQARPSPPPHAFSQSNVHQSPPLPPAVPQHSLSAPNIHAPLANPRAIRVPPPPFLNQYQGFDESWNAPPQPGAGGVAYAGGAVSNKVAYAPYEAAARPPGAATTTTTTTVTTTMTTKEGSPSSSSASQPPPRSSPKTHTREKSGSMSSPPAPRQSPQYHHSPIGSPQGEMMSAPSATVNSAPAMYGYEQPYRVATPSSLRKSTLPTTGSSDSDTPSMGAGGGAVHGQTPPLLMASTSSTSSSASAAKARATEDRSLPFQEEPEEELASHSSSSASTSTSTAQGSAQRWKPSPTVAMPKAQDYAVHTPPGQPQVMEMGHPEAGYEARRVPTDGRVSRAENREASEDDDTTLNEHEDDDTQQQQQQLLLRGSLAQNGVKKDADTEDILTPRSPTADLPDTIHMQMGRQHGAPAGGASYNQSTVRGPKQRSTSEQIPFPAFDPVMFQQTMSQLGARAETMPGYLYPPAQLAAPHPGQHARVPYPHLQIPNEHNLRSFFENPTPSDAPSYSYHHGQLPMGEGTGLSLGSSAYSHPYSQNQPRPDAPIPPTPHSQTAAPSPSPLLSAMPPDNGMRGPHAYGSPAPPSASPYPYPYDHVRRSSAYGSFGPSAPSPSYEMMMQVQEQMAAQMRSYALNNLVVSDSTMSPESTPYPTNYQPWKFLQTSRVYANPTHRVDTSMSLRSSPSHEPVQLPAAPRAYRKRPAPFKPSPSNLGNRPKIQPPPRVESTQPRDTSPEPTSGDETAGEDNQHGHRHHHDGEPPSDQTPLERDYTSSEDRWVNGLEGVSALEVGEWIEDSEDEVDEDELLELEFHPTFVSNTDKRRRRWEAKYDALVKAFQALDRETDATMVLMAAPNHPGAKLHAITSRAVRRDPSLLHSPQIHQMKSSFNHIAIQRQSARSHINSLADRFAVASTPGPADSPAGEREEELRRMLNTALTSLGALGDIYERREGRWREEMRRLNEDRESVETLLRQALGFGPPQTPGGIGNGTFGLHPA